MGKNKTYSNIFITTSGDSIDRSAYSQAETYESIKRNDINITITHHSTRYGGVVEKTKIHTPATRRQDKLLSINEKLKGLR